MAVVGEKGSVELAEGVLVRAGRVVLVGVDVVDSGTVSVRNWCRNGGGNTGR